jgi:uncharacterized protein YfdQ (DUF2303 family)
MTTTSAEMKELVQEIRTLALQAHKCEIREVANVPDKACFVQAPGKDGEVLFQNLRAFMPECPSRVVSSRRLLDLASFLAYLAEYKRPESRVFAALEKEPATFTAVIDWHKPLALAETAAVQAGWCGHEVTLELRSSIQFQAWKAKDGKMMAQADFAEFLKDNRLDVIQPCNADLLGLVMGLELTAERRCLGKVATNQGQALKFEEDVRAEQGGKPVVLPSEIKLALPLFVGGGLVQLTADFKVRMESGRLSFGYRLLGLDRAVRDAVELMRAEIAKVCPVYV